jgi:uncharacterized protein (TIGR03083 family)
MREAFRQAAGYFVQVVDQVSENGWQSAALGVWTVRDLVGHTSRSLSNVETYSAEPGNQVDIQTPGDYFRRAMASLANPESVAERGRQAGQDLGSHPVETVRRISERVVAQVEQASDDLILALPIGGMRLIDYLPTRVFELVIHGLDLASAIGVGDEPPNATMEVTLRLLADLALESGKASDLALAVTGRKSLPEGFNLVG